VIRWLQIAHHLPERTRLRSPVLRKDAAACERLADALAVLPGVREVRARPFTGSALIQHAPEVSIATLVDTAKRVLDCARVLAIGERPPIDTRVPPLATLARTLVATVHELDRDLRRASEGTVDLGTLATVGFFGAGALEIATSGNLPMPPWFNLAWWGFRTFVTTEQDEIDAELGGQEAPGGA
jgi:hypothetical protein